MGRVPHGERLDMDLGDPDTDKQELLVLRLQDAS